MSPTNNKTVCLFLHPLQCGQVINRLWCWQVFCCGCNTTWIFTIYPCLPVFYFCGLLQFNANPQYALAIKKYTTHICCHSFLPSFWWLDLGHFVPSTKKREKTICMRQITLMRLKGIKTKTPTPNTLKSKKFFFLDYNRNTLQKLSSMENNG